MFFQFFWAESRTRTGDLFITNELLYQLSYFGDTLFFLKCDAKVVNNILLAKYFAYFFSKPWFLWSEDLVSCLNLFQIVCEVGINNGAQPGIFPFREICSLLIDYQRKGEIPYVETSRFVENLLVFSF